MFNVFIGNNGAGKSSFFRALSFLRDLVRHDSINTALDMQGATFADLVNLRAQEKAIKFQCRVQKEPLDKADASFDADVRIVVKKRKFLYIDSESVLPWDRRGIELESESDLEDLPYGIYRFRRTMIAHEKGYDSIHYSNAVVAHSLLRDVLRHHHLLRLADKQPRFPALSYIARNINSYRHFEIWGPGPLRLPSKQLGAPSRYMSEDGQGLASTLFSLRRLDRDKFDLLLDEMQHAYPWLNEIEFRRYPDSSLGLSFAEKSGLPASSRNHGRSYSTKKYNSNQVSDGFLRFLALATVKYTANRSWIIAYEEPENGLHPSLIGRTAKMLRQIAESGTQVLVSTHSPMFVSEVFAAQSAEQVANELRLVRRHEQGDTTISSVDVKKIEETMSHGLSVGDMWSMLLDEKYLES